MTQTQTVYGQCNEEASKKREVPCEYLGPWNKSTGHTCPSDDGIHRWWRTTVNSSAPTTKTEPCDVDCRGYHHDPECPTGCGIPETTLRRDWVTQQSPKNDGAACPSPSSKTCPAVRCIDDYEAGGAWINRNTFLGYCNEDGCNSDWNTTWTGSTPTGEARDRYRQEFHDWKSQATRDKYAEQCAKNCNNTSGCKAFTLDQQRCKLYSSADTSGQQSLCIKNWKNVKDRTCLLYTSPSTRAQRAEPM